MSEPQEPQTATYVIAYVVLLLLLAATYFASTMPLGSAHLPVALAFASAKAIVIGLYFMHLRKTVHLNRLAACAAFAWLAVLFALAFADYATRA